MDNGQAAEAALASLGASSENFTSTAFTISQIIATTALVIGLLFVIHKVSTNHPKAREYTVAWFVAIALYIIFLIQE